MAGLIVEDGKFLITQRASYDSNGGKWEFAGGKVEDGESLETALVRELKEELNLQTKVIRLFGRNEFKTERATFDLYLYLCRRLSGTIYLTEHDDFKWITLDEIPNYEFLGGDVPFLEELVRLGVEGIKKLEVEK